MSEFLRRSSGMFRRMTFGNKSDDSKAADQTTSSDGKTSNPRDEHDASDGDPVADSAVGTTETADDDTFSSVASNDETNMSASLPESSKGSQQDVAATANTTLQFVEEVDQSETDDGLLFDCEGSDPTDSTASTKESFRSRLKPRTRRRRAKVRPASPGTKSLPSSPGQEPVNRSLAATPVADVSPLQERCDTMTSDTFTTPLARFKQQSRHKRSISDVVTHDFADLDESTDSEPEPEFRKEGVVAKWTNYIHGWQDRYLVLHGAVLSYFKSAEHKKKACRGTIDLADAHVRKHQFDSLRFDIAMSDQVYYLRASTEQDREVWVDILTKAKASVATGLSRRGSSLSLASMASVQSSTSNQAAGRGYAEKFVEVCTSHDALMKQITTVQSSLSALEDTEEARSNLFTFKATAGTMMNSLTQCIELMARREEEWQRKYERANERRRRLETTLRQMQQTPQHNPYNNPDFEEGPHSALNEEEFFDALETGLEQLDAEIEAERREKEMAEKVHASRSADNNEYASFIEETVTTSQDLALEPPDSNWTIVHQDGPMKVYRRETADDGSISDRLKAYHVVRGVSARELCYYFFDVDRRFEWEHTVEKLIVLDKVDENTQIIHNMHKRVWPAAQRDSCMLSHLRQVGDHRWIVQNVSVDHPAAPANVVRIQLNIFMLVDTILPENGETPTRENTSARITYLAYVNPGGWAPPSVVRSVSKREYPRFLRSFEECSVKYLADKPLAL